MRTLTLKKRLGWVLEPLVRRAFRLSQPFGLHVLRNHFYSPVLDTSRISDSSFLRHSSLVGIDMNDQSHDALMRAVFPKYVSECDFPTEKPRRAASTYLGNDYFEAVDAEVYHCFIRHYRPRQVLEIGSGNYTRSACRGDEPGGGS